MGFSLKKAVKSVTKSVAKVVPKVTVGKDLGLQSIKDTTAKATDLYVDGITLGQADKVDDVTGGAATSLKGAYRGNSSDIIRTGAVIGASVAGGPAAGYAVNGAFANGGSIADAGIAYFANQGGAIPTGKIIGDIGNSLFGNNPPSVKPTTSYDSFISGENQNDSNLITYLIIGGGALVSLLVFLKNKG